MRTLRRCSHTFQYTFADTSRILSNATYFDGNATKYDWVVNSGTILNSTTGEIAMILTGDNGGTRLSSTRYVHYGTMTARSACSLGYSKCSPLTLQCSQDRSLARSRDCLHYDV